MMKWIRTLHLYLGCLFAPMLIFFCASGAWQLFGFHSSTKDGSYVPPKWVSTMSQVHKYQGINGPSYDTVSEAFRWFSLLPALGMIVTALLGLVMAFRQKNRRWPSVIATLLGLLPIAFLWFASN